MSIVWSGLAPHPPVLIPSVGLARSRQVAQTRHAMNRLVAGFLATKAERLVVISPHAPRPRGGISTWFTQTLSGHFGNFGAPQSRLSLTNDVAWLKRFTSRFSEVCPATSPAIDHGALVPLMFFAEAGWCGPTAILGLPWIAGDMLTAMGKAIAASSDDRPTGLLASGDMSHCLIPGAPAGHDPLGTTFDERFVQLIRTGQFQAACRLEPHLLDRAKQDVYESCRVVWEATEFADCGAAFFSYECPFGVGYSVMQFHEAHHELV